MDKALARLQLSTGYWTVQSAESLTLSALVKDSILKKKKKKFIPICGHEGTGGIEFECRKDCPDSLEEECKLIERL